MKTPGCPDGLNLKWFPDWRLWICEDNWYMEGGCPWEDYPQPPAPDYLQEAGMGL